MAFQDTNLVETVAKPEASYDASPAAGSVANGRVHRIVKDGLKRKGEMRRSKVITATRARAPMAQTYVSSEGTIMSEFMGGEWDNYIAALLGAALPGSLTSGDEFFKNAYGSTAEVLTSFVIERNYKTAGVKHAFRGLEVDEIVITFKSKEYAEIEIKFMGAHCAQASTSVFASGSKLGALVSPSVKCGVEVTSIRIADTLGDLAELSATVEELKVTLKTNLRERPFLRGDSTKQHGRGEIGATIAIKAYFDATAASIVGGYYNTPDASFALDFSILADPFTYRFEFPRVQIQDAQADVGGVNADVISDIVFETCSYNEAQIDAPAGYEIGVERLEN